MILSIIVLLIDILLVRIPWERKYLENIAVMVLQSRYYTIYTVSKTEFEFFNHSFVISVKPAYVTNDLSEEKTVRMKLYWEKGRYITDEIYYEELEG